MEFHPQKCSVLSHPEAPSDRASIPIERNNPNWTKQQNTLAWTSTLHCLGTLILIEPTRKLTTCLASYVEIFGTVFNIKK
ncbi:hypothetical protein DPMN_043190 [Dreissena polymorpha]|uniref:Uncharacterized protein n=1 Tax=Dreissena polymorpha TaxID=45954 RepID=A0A9D4D012_DREPO|nr:hypothetical protein DPMN_043190 [Dreissena polymorpha]